LAYITLEGVRSRFESRRTILTHLGQEVLDHRADVAMELAFDGLRVRL
jgi:hypothetical protein